MLNQAYGIGFSDASPFNDGHTLDASKAGRELTPEAFGLVPK